MRHLLLTTLLFSSIALAQEKFTGADEASLNRDAAGKPIVLKTKKLAAPTTSTSTNQHHQTDTGFLNERSKISTTTPHSGGGFSCPDGTGAACLDAGDKVCPGSARCVDEGATCFAEFPCDLSSGFVCASKHDDVIRDYQQTVREYNQLAAENVALREQRLERKNCVINAASLKAAIRCVR
jgi:hypothetical protein